MEIQHRMEILLRMGRLTQISKELRCHMQTTYLVEMNEII